MTNLRQIHLASLVVCAVLSTVTAQESSTGAKQTLTITVSATAEGVRVTAPPSIVQLRLEVYAASGEKVFDDESRGANVFDWRLQNGQAQRLPAGDYVCVVTAKSISGKLTQKMGAVTVAENSASAGRAETLTSSQAQAIGPVEEGSSWTVIPEGDNQTTTVIASNGNEGQMIRGRGALSFRLGNFFSGIDQEQMRLTETGNLGIGTPDPKGKLDVAGTIRAERFLVVKPKLAGSDKTLAAGAADSDDSVQPLATGTGTLNQIAKWTDNAGTLGDSTITEAGTNIGIGTTSPGFLLDARTNSVSNATIGISSTLGAPPANVGFLTSVDSLNRGRYDFFWNGGSGGLALRNGSNTAGNILFFTNSSGTNGLGQETEKARIDKAGNLGLGTSSPGFLLDAQTNSSNATIAISSTLGSPPPNVGFLASVDSLNRGRFDFFWNSASGGLALRNGSNTAGNILFFTNSSGTNGLGQETEKVRISRAGNVGIGTTTPTAKLDVAGDVNFMGFRTETNATSPNVIGGFSGNTVTPSSVGATIGGGGGDAGFGGSLANRVTDNYGTVAGGINNRAGDDAGTTFDKQWATVGGGNNNTASGTSSTVGGGAGNTASGTQATVGGGLNNTASNFFSTAGGGLRSMAIGHSSTVGGGGDNTASGAGSTVPGGLFNTAQGDYSFAAGIVARALHKGSFVWSDSTAVSQDGETLIPFFSTGNNQFLINATGGVGIGTNAPGFMLDVVGRSRIRQNAGQTGGTNSAGIWLFQNTPAADRAFVGMETDNSVGFFGNNGAGWGMIMNTQTGKVGIGTTGPLFKLQVLDQSNAGLRVQTNIAGGTVASFGGFGEFQIDAAGNPGGRLTVKENGFVGIGLNNPDRQLVVNGSAAKPGGGSWDAFSDERLKTIKGSFTPGLRAAMQLQPLRYEYKPDNALGIRSSGEHIGFGAQALQKIIPEAVTKNAQGYLLVNNDPIMWTMLNAIKEQQKEVEAQQRIAQQQQDQIAALRTENAALNARLQMIERTLNSRRGTKRR